MTDELQVSAVVQPLVEAALPVIVLTEAQQLMSSLSLTEQSIAATLNSYQLKAFSDILTWSKDTAFGSLKGHTLVGYAGTGKTYLIKLIASVLQGSVVLAAPTNKAVKELKKLNTGYECSTIYSLLGLKMEQNEDKVKLVKADSNRIYKYRYVILDECGMIGTELFDYILDAMRSGVRFLFVGDPKQLPPVGEKTSPVWKKFPVSALLKVERHDNQILELATAVRSAPRLRDLVIVSNNVKTEGVWVLNSQKFDERIRKFARNGLFETDSKVIAWRNKTVDFYNHIVRHVLYGDRIYESKFFVGDRVVFTSPYEIDRNTNIFTDDEAIVKNIVVAKHTDYEPLQVYYLTIDLYGKELIIKVIHEDSESKLESMLNGIANEARKPGNGKMWKDFWGLRTSVCNVKYAYALTAHRAQGSTYRNVFVSKTDIMCNPNRGEAKKCFYVSITRPSTKLYIT